MKPRTPSHWFSSLLVGAFALGGASALQAQTSSKINPDLNRTALAAACASCHGSNGHVVSGSAVPNLAGMPKTYMLTQLKAFKDGSRPATVMQQLVKGLTDEQMDDLASYFATVKR